MRSGGGDEPGNGVSDLAEPTQSSGTAATQEMTRERRLGLRVAPSRVAHCVIPP
jgi:hypothetical protein